MTTNSKNKTLMESEYKIMKWIDSVIKSCNTWDQITTAQRLVDNFKSKLEKSDYDKLLGLPMTISLEQKIYQKRKSLIEGNNLLINN